MTAKLKQIWKALPQDPITPEIEQRIVRAVRKLRAADKETFKVRTRTAHALKIKTP